MMVYDDSELSEEATIRNFRIAQTEGSGLMKKTTNF